MAGAVGERFEAVIDAGGLALFPSDTVYGLACSPLSSDAIERLYALKQRPPDKSAAVMFFSLDAAFAALPELGPRTRAALSRLLPGGVTVLVPNPSSRFPLACRADPGTLGVRVVSVPALAGVGVAVMQSSANLSGGPDAHRLADVAPEILAGVDLVIDGGELGGVPSTVVDLRRFEEDDGPWWVLRLGAVDGDLLAVALGGRFHFHPSTYVEMLRADIPDYETLQQQVVLASGPAARRILDLGTGMGETAARLLERHPGAVVVGVDEDAEMLEAARARLGPSAVGMHAQLLQAPLPPGPYDLVSSALAIHHLDNDEKADLFTRIRAELAPGGRIVLADVVVPEDPADAVTGLSPGYDKPSPVGAQLQWLRAAGFASVRTVWAHRDLAVIVAS